MATIVRCLLLVALLIAVVLAQPGKSLRGQELGLQEEHEQRLLQQTPIQQTQNCILSDLSRSSFLQPAFSSLPTSYSVEFALSLNTDLTTTGFTGILRLSDNRVSTGGSGLFTRLPGVYLCPGTGYPIANSLCTAPYQLYLSYVGIAGPESVAVASPALVPNTIYRVVINVDRATPLPLGGVRVTMNVFNFYSASPILATASLTSPLALDNNLYPLPVVLALPPATADGTNLFPPANAFAGCAAFSQSQTPTFAPTSSPNSTPAPKPGPTPAPKPGPKTGPSSGPEKSGPSPKKPSPAREVLQSLVDTEDLVE